MDQPFPFGFPTATARYLTLYVVTFAVHHAFMHYVVAGSMYIAWATLSPGKSDKPRADQPLAALLRDWLPFALSAAITAGVAPLLFVQIVYPRHFYTANLLLSWRWMIVVPALIAAFYLLYVIKSAPLSHWPAAKRGAVVVTTAALFLFVGFCWTANYLVSVTPENWSQAYAQGSFALPITVIALRTLIWLGTAFSSLAVIAGWQLHAVEDAHHEARRLARGALGGLALAGIASIAYLAISAIQVRELATSPLALPYVIGAATTAVVQAGAWIQVLRRSLTRTWLLVATLSWLVMLLAASVVRETIRLASIDVVELYPRHAAASEIGGLSVFLLFTLVNAAIIAGCIWLVRRELGDE